MTKKWVRTFAECGATKFYEHPYITIGKWYEVIGDCDDQSFTIVDDDGDMPHCLWKGCTHLGGSDWEVYEGETPPQEKTS